MSKDYETIHLIQEQMEDVGDELTNLVVRMYNRLEKKQRYASGLSTSITLFLAMKYLGYNPLLILGTVRFQGVSFPHAWLDLYGNIVDIAIAEDTKYHPVLSEKVKPVKVQCCRSYDEAELDYFDFQFSDMWPMHGMKQVVGKTLAEYINSAEEIDILAEVCDILNISAIVDNGKKIYEMAKEYKIYNTAKEVYVNG